MPIGNDVVDLRDPETLPGALSPRFDARVFTGHERRALEASGKAARQRRWRLWAAKEAAYKAARKLDPTISWSPVRFAVREFEHDLDAAETPRGQNRGRGQVDCAAGRFDVEWQEGDRFVHAVAWGSCGVIPSVHRAVAMLGERDPSRAVRELARERMAEWLGRPERQLQVRMGEGASERIPSLWVASLGVALDLSLSHHGQLAAFACLLPARTALAGREPAGVGAIEKGRSALPEGAS